MTFDRRRFDGPVSANYASTRPPVTHDEVARVDEAASQALERLRARLEHLGKALGPAVTAGALEDLQDLESTRFALGYIAHDAVELADHKAEQITTLTKAHESTLAAVEAKARDRSDLDLDQIHKLGRRVEALERQIKARLEPRAARRVIRYGRAAMSDE